MQVRVVCTFCTSLNHPTVALLSAQLFAQQEASPPLPFPRGDLKTETETSYFYS